MSLSRELSVALLAATLPLLLSCSSRAPAPLTFPHPGSVEQANEPPALGGLFPLSPQPGAPPEVSTPDDSLPPPPSEIQPPSDVLGVSLGTDVLPVRGIGEQTGNPEIAIPAAEPIDQSLIIQPPGDQNQLNSDQVRQLLIEVGTPPEWIDPFVRIAWCESKWSPAAHGDSGNSVGLYQIGRSRPGWAGWFTYLGIDEATALDPLVNTRTAVAIAHYSVARGQSPFSAWSCQP